MSVINDIRASEDTTISVEQASKVLRVSPQSLRDDIRDHPERIGYKYIISGKKGGHVQIVRLSFLQWLGYSDAA